MPDADLNLLRSLNVLLAEGSVTSAALRLRLSSSAMSRALARLRNATGDPLLVRAGRGLVPTPRAIELRGRVSQIVQDAEAVLRAKEKLDLKRLVRTFTVRSSEGFVENFGPALIARVRKEAPGARMRFVQKVDKNSTLLREGAVDLETGVLATEMSPEVRAQALFQDRLVGVVRGGHPLCRGRITPARYAAAGHIDISRPTADEGLVEERLGALGLERQIVIAVGGFSAALAVARGSDLVATVPERHTGVLRAGMHSFTLPFSFPAISISLFWHPRLDADPAHRWLRECIRAVCAMGAI